MIIKINKYFSIYNNIEDSFILVPNNNPFYQVSGIYMIKNIITNDIYIGQSINIGSRLNEHKNLLRKNRHVYSNDDCDVLQKSWNKYGENNFKFYIVEISNSNDLDNKEKYWIRYFNCNRRKSGKGFNLTDGGNKPPVGSFNKGRIHLKSPDNRKTIAIKPEELDKFLAEGYTRGIANSDLIAKKCIETRIKNGTLSIKGKIPNWTEERKELMKKTLSDRVIIHLNDIEKRIKKIYLDEYLTQGWQIGRKPNYKPYKRTKKVIQSKQQIAKIAQAKWKTVLQYDLNWNFIAEYASLKEASEKTGIKLGYIWSIIHNKKKKNKCGYIFKYKDIV